LYVIRHLPHGGHHVRSPGNDLNLLCSKQPEKEVVPSSFRVVASSHPLFQDKPASKAFFDSRGERQAAMVGLDGSASDKGIGTLRQGVCNQELELTGFIAAGGKPQKIVPLHIDIRAVKSLSKPGQKLQRCRAFRVPSAREFGEVHGPSPDFIH